MNKTAAVAVLLGAVGFGLWAVPADITYTEGDASVKLKSGRLQDAQIGDRVNTGDTIRTGADGQVELDQKGVTIRIASGTVFTMMEKSQAGSSSTVLSVALGSIKFRYGKLTGTEPQVRTNSAVAAVRGTEFTVFSGADGSTLITVDSGQVTVESAGASVDIAANEGVEIPLGQPPGDKFTVQRTQVDYSTWNADKLAAMLADPQAAMTSIETAMASYIKDVNDYAASFQEANARLQDEQTKRAAIAKDQGVEAGRKYEAEVVAPLANQVSAVGLNLRYSSLAALSLRRYVAGRLYVMLKARFIANPDDAAWTGFLAKYGELLQSFDSAIAPHLVEADL